MLTDNTKKYIGLPLYCNLYPSNDFS